MQTVRLGAPLRHSRIVVGLSVLAAAGACALFASVDPPAPVDPLRLEAGCAGIDADYCEDFDHGFPDAALVSDASTLVLWSANSVTPPFSAQLNMPANPGAPRDLATGLVVPRASNGHRRIVVDWDVYITENADAYRAHAVLAVDGTSFVRLVQEAAGWSIRVAPSSSPTDITSYPVAAPPKTDEWVHLTLDVNFADEPSGAVRLSVIEGGSRRALLDVNEIRTSPVKYPSLLVAGIGLLPIGPTTSASTSYIDDVVVRLE